MTYEQPSYIYGPVYSWRLGYSLGIDPVSDRHKICNYDCPYCQLGRTDKYVTERQDFVPVETILREIDAIPETTRIDFYTFSGRGEPTLAKNLGAMIRALKERTQKNTAVITNSSLLHLADVREDLMAADYVSAKLDAGTPCGFEDMDLPDSGIDFDIMVKGIKMFCEQYKGMFALQVMFTDQNIDEALEIATIAREIAADEVQLNTPLRACGETPLSADQMIEIKKMFIDMPAVTVYERERKTAEAEKERSTIQRHGRQRKQSS